MLYNDCTTKKMMRSKQYAFVLALCAFWIASCNPNTKDDTAHRASESDFILPIPNHGYLTTRPAEKWEESMLTGNGTIGALVFGNPLQETLILSHEQLFMPQYPPFDPPDLGSRLAEMRRLILNGNSEGAAELVTEAGQEVGIDDMIWTNPLVPACQMELVALNNEDVQDYARSVNYETGEAITAWETASGQFRRSTFTSRADNAIITKITSANEGTLNLNISLSQLPVNEEENSEEQEFRFDDLIELVDVQVSPDGQLSYSTKFRKQWDGSLKGYIVETSVLTEGGTMESGSTGLSIREASEITIFNRILLSYENPIRKDTGLSELTNQSYDQLLARHAAIHGEMFNRFSLRISDQDMAYQPPEELISSSSVDQVSNKLVEELCKAARYTLMSSTGELPPSLQGIWGGTWLPAWSGDFTLNGNVPSAIASGLNTNFQEVTEAYINYMSSMYEDFERNAKGLFGASGIFVPSRSSSSGSTYHFAEEYPHLLWFAGNAWTAQFFYDYWQYTGDKEFLVNKAIPFMLASMDFYEEILTRDSSGNYVIVPSYSPELGPIGKHPLAVNATMDVAGIKQLIRNLLKLIDQSYLDDTKRSQWQEILRSLPKYAVDEDGVLKEWIWDDAVNDNEHRHASHLYPLFYEADPEILQDNDLRSASIQAIEERMKYRRANNGAEMAFGLVQKGLAATHLGATDYAYECVSFLSTSYWSPAFTSYHDPGAIFNVDISGGLPALVTEMIVQSSSESITLLPTLPAQWENGEIKGVLTRCGVTVDLTWDAGEVKSLNLKATRDTQFLLIGYREEDLRVSLRSGQTKSFE